MKTLENTLYLLNFATTKTFVEIYQIASCIIYSYVHIEDSPTKNHKGDKPQCKRNQKQIPRNFCIGF